MNQNMKYVFGWVITEFGQNLLQQMPYLLEVYTFIFDNRQKLSFTLHWGTF